jgi:hypothetical protein
MTDNTPGGIRHRDRPAARRRRAGCFEICGLFSPSSVISQPDEAFFPVGDVACDEPQSHDSWRT